MIWKIVPLSPTRQVHHNTIIKNLRVIADLPNTQRQNRETKKNAPNKKSPEKELNEIDEIKATKNTRCGVLKKVIRMLLKDLRVRRDDLSENLNKEIARNKKDIESIKKKKTVR